ncbi:hypothetical protein CERZMDRAFT_93291 [Cercospora zeae-maydis SCOH1-5]|uniref:FAD linked oxidase N-terminal domain-containing protein n=1 Tax=Cercospora zeae-maydis SCOH1-5 TaxID=717836 RepID=A0A6A6FVG1_9PEZI|nr:hypothetical protein CERZMDRAFT_93291 [Cercospora zeae-maydis SCOH1-5]
MRQQLSRVCFVLRSCLESRQLLITLSLEDAGLKQALIYPDDVTAFEASVDKHFSQVAQLWPQCFLQPGASGLMIGGGNSFFAARLRFVCDDVASFKVVLANGTTVTASKHENPDLLQVLKGGNLDFGIVTKIALNTSAALVKFGNGINDERHAFTIVVGHHDSAKNMTIFLNAYEYTKPVHRPDAKIF